jgi:DNA-binding PadR family transcriptional regulator
MQRTNMELFVLAAVRAGLETSYDLNKKADLSVGATIPLLARLQEDGLLESARSVRNSRRYSLTATGDKVFQQQWRQLLLSHPSDLESILRIAYLAIAMKTDARTVRSFLRMSAQQRKHLGALRARDASSLLIPTAKVSFGVGYRWLRACCDAARLRGEAAMLLRIAKGRSLFHLSSEEGGK